MSINLKRFVTLLRSMSEHDIILPVLVDVIEGQLVEGNIVVDSFSLKTAPFGVFYDMDSNKILLNAVSIESLLQSNTITRLINYLKNKTGLMSDKSYIKGLSKSNLGLFIGAILYYGIHIYNRFNRGELIKNASTKRWYIEFLYRNIYYYSGQLTTMPRQAAMLLYYPYMWLIFEQFEMPMYRNLSFTEDRINKILGTFSNYNKLEIEPKLAQMGLDQPSLDIYHKWFIDFNKTLKILFYNQNKRIANLSQDILDENEIEILKFDALQNAYDVINTSDVVSYRFPTPIFRELFVTSEPLAQSLFGVYIDGKVAGHEDWQKISARGISLLG